MTITIKINNTPDYAENRKYIVANYCEGGFWFYGAWDDKDRAQEVAAEIGAFVFENK